MKVNAWLVVCIGMLLALVGLLSCTPARESDAVISSANQATVPATTDQTATSAAKIIELALSATHTTTPAPDFNAMATAAAQQLATAVAATLTAVPTATPDLAATQTMQAQNMATAVAATLAAQLTNTPTPTPTEDFVATQTAVANQLATAVSAALTAQPTATAAVRFPASLERIHFSEGSTIYTISTELAPGIAKGYVLRVLAGQQMFILTENRINLVVLDPDNQELAPATTNAGRWAFAIAQTGDHTLIIAGEGNATISLEIPPPQSASPSRSSAPQRIRFAAGSISYTFTPHLTENAPQTYVLGVSAGQQIVIDVDRSLELRAFDPNGDELTSSSDEFLKWQFTATQTGDYTIMLQGTGDVTVTIYIPPL